MPIWHQTRQVSDPRSLTQGPIALGQIPGAQLMGIEGSSQVYTTKEAFKRKDPGGAISLIRPLILDMAINLLGKEILEALNVILSNSMESEYIQIEDCDTLPGVSPNSKSHC